MRIVDEHGRFFLRHLSKNSKFSIFPTMAVPRAPAEKKTESIFRFSREKKERSKSPLTSSRTSWVDTGRSGGSGGLLGRVQGGILGHPEGSGGHLGKDLGDLGATF